MSKLAWCVSNFEDVKVYQWVFTYISRQKKEEGKLVSEVPTHLTWAVFSEFQICYNHAKPC
jgi:hypothetical protein